MATDTESYKLNHTMIRVKDPRKSIKFYEYLGMKLVRKNEQPEANFDLYFLGYDSPRALSYGRHSSDREGLIELTHNYGTESNEQYSVSTGNSEPFKGYGHTCISVDNIQAACQRIEEAGYMFQKKLSEGSMKNIAFVRDPDGYWVEIIGQKDIEETKSLITTDPGTYRMNHTMIRVKDHEESLRFYQEVMGMKVVGTFVNKQAQFNLYFLAYDDCDNEAKAKFPTNDLSLLAKREGLLELTWNYGTEKEVGFKYHNGNDEPQGFGHICISVDNIENACERFEKLGVKWRKRLTEGRMKSIAFMLDPDGYSIEIIQNQSLKK